MNDNFKIEPLSVVIKEQMKKAGVWKEGCPVPLDHLRYLTIMHYDFSDKTQLGEMVVHMSVAEATIAIFKELLTVKFPIAKMKLIDHYKGNDDASMEDNNSSAFNYRKIAGSSTTSMHAYGLAIDINPVQNPYIVISKKAATAKIHPNTGVDYLNRSNIRKGMIENVTKIFTKQVFSEWGGDWNSVLDYQHFQVPRNKLKNFIK